MSTSGRPNEVLWRAAAEALRIYIDVSSLGAQPCSPRGQLVWGEQGVCPSLSADQRNGNDQMHTTLMLPFTTCRSASTWPQQGSHRQHHDFDKYGLDHTPRIPGGIRQSGGEGAPYGRWRDTDVLCSISSLLVHHGLIKGRVLMRVPESRRQDVLVSR